MAIIEAGGAGAGWERTGQTFPAWTLLGADQGAYICRFYGSLSPGPNSHFFTLSPHDCNFLLDQQEKVPSAQPRWNFERYAFMAIPARGEEGRHGIVRSLMCQFIELTTTGLPEARIVTITL